MIVRFVVAGRWYEYASPTGAVLPDAIRLPVLTPRGCGEIRLERLAVEHGVAVFAAREDPA